MHENLMYMHLLLKLLQHLEIFGQNTNCFDFYLMNRIALSFLLPQLEHSRLWYDIKSLKPHYPVNSYHQLL